MFRAIFTSPVTSVSRTALRTPTSATLLRKLLSNDARAQIQKAVEGKPVVLFMKGTPSFPQCGFSRAAIQVLDLHGVPPEKMQTYNVLEDQELRSGIKEFSDWPTIPQIYVGGEFVGGADIMLSMHQSGELEKLLVDNDVVPKVEAEVAESAA